MAGEEKLGEAVLFLSTKAKDLLDGIDKGKVAADGLQSKFNSVASGIQSAFAALGIGVSFGVILHETIAAEDAFNNLQSAVQSTGQAAGFTADQLALQATAFQEMTRFSDEAVMKMQATLLTFRNIQGEVFRDAQKAALDFAQATGRDAAEAARTLGMALQDPVQGMTMLRRAGVLVNNAVKEQIRDLAEHGHLVQAQTLLIDEFSKAYGGRAAAAVNTLGGALDQLKNKFSDTFLEIKGPIRDTFVDFVKLITDNLGDISARFNAVFAGFKKLVEDVIERLFNLGSGVANLFKGEVRAALADFNRELEDTRAPAEVAAEVYLQMTQAAADMAGRLKEVTVASGAAGAGLDYVSERALAAAAAAKQSAIDAAASVQTALRGVVIDSTLSYDQLVAKAREAAESAAAAARLSALMAGQGMTENAERFKQIAAANAAEAQKFSQAALAASARVKAENRQMAASVGQAMGQIAGNLLTGKLAFADLGKAVAQAALQMIAQLIALKAASAFLGGFGGGLFSAFAGGVGKRAHGGPVSAGTPYMVGEQGPELFLPDRSGTIVPNNDLGGGGGTQVTVNNTISGADFGDERTVQRILRGITQAARSGVAEAMDAAGVLAERATLEPRRLSA